MSLPVASQASPLATAAAEPPDDPPGVKRVSQGLRVTPNTSLTVFPPAPNSGVLDLAMTIAPFASSRSTRMSEREAIRSAKTRDPSVQRTPATAVRSLMTIGRP